MLPTLSLLLLTSSPLLAQGKSMRETILEEMDSGLQFYNRSWFSADQVSYSGNAPFDVPLSEWNDHLDDPDATMTVDIPIPDLTEPFKEQDLAISRVNAQPQLNFNGMGWTWRIDLADNISVTVPKEEEGEEEGGGDEQEGVTTGVRIRLQASDYVTEGMADSWQVCVMQWMLKEGTNTSTFYQMQGSVGDQCLMSKECVTDLQNYAASGPAGFGRCQCPDPSTFESCKGYLFPEWATCYTSPYKASDVRKWKNGTLDVMNYAGRPHDENDNGFGYNATAMLTFPVMVVWALDGDVPPESSSASSATSSTLRSLTSAVGTRTGRVTTTPTLTLSSVVDGLSTATATVTRALTSSSTDGASSPSGTGGPVKRQSSDSDGPRYAAAKLSCLAPRLAVAGKKEAGIPVLEKNSALGKTVGMSSLSLLVVSGFAAALALI